VSGRSHSRTTTALLAALRDPRDARAWEELVDRCEPILLGVARRMGASPEDAADLVQTSLLAFVEAWREGRYDRTRGRVSRFLVAILRARHLDARRRRLRREEISLERLGDLETPLSDSAMEEAWRDERRRALLARGIEELRAQGVAERTLEAFDLHALRGIEVEAIVERLGMTREEVYDAKYRVVRRLRPIVARLEELYEDL
jgi:RNA polymerase sigma factor (sigma-70 family)